MRSEHMKQQLKVLFLFYVFFAILMLKFYCTKTFLLSHGLKEKCKKFCPCFTFLLRHHRHLNRYLSNDISKLFALLFFFFFCHSWIRIIIKWFLSRKHVYKYISRANDRTFTSWKWTSGWPGNVTRMKESFMSAGTKST